MPSPHKSGASAVSPHRVLDLARDALAPLGDTCARWWWLVDHPAFRDDVGLSRFHDRLDIALFRTDEAGRLIADGERGRTVVWLEVSPWSETSGLRPLSAHAPSFEEAIASLTEIVRERWGDYEDVDTGAIPSSPEPVRVCTGEPC